MCRVSVDLSEFKYLRVCDAIETAIEVSEDPVQRQRYRDVLNELQSDNPVVGDSDE